MVRTINDIESSYHYFLKNTFKYVYNYKGFYIVGDDIKPLYSYKNNDANTILLQIQNIAKNLMENIDESIMLSIGINFVCIYSNKDTIDVLSKFIYDTYDREVIGIYNNDLLHYSYENNNILINKLNNNSWKPLGPLQEYNMILEVLYAVIYKTYTYEYPKLFRYGKDSYLLNILEYDITKGYNINKITKNTLLYYTYQIWLIYINGFEKILSFHQMKVIKLFKNLKTVPLTYKHKLLIITKENKKLSLTKKEKIINNVEQVTNNIEPVTNTEEPVTNTEEPVANKVETVIDNVETVTNDSIINNKDPMINIIIDGVLILLIIIVLYMNYLLITTCD